MVQSTENDCSVSLFVRLVLAALAADGQRLGLVPAGNVLRVWYPARAPLDAAAPIRNLAATVLFRLILSGKFALDKFEIALVLYVLRGFVENEVPTGIENLVAAGHKDRFKLSESESCPSGLQPILPRVVQNGVIGDLHRKVIIECAGFGVDSNVVCHVLSLLCINYCKYYEVVYILFHTGMRISEFCGLTISDIDFEHHLINIDHQLQRCADMTLVIQETKTHAGTRKIPMTEDVEKCFRAIIEDRPTPKIERMVDGYSGFLFLDKNCLPEVAMHWEHRFNHMVKRYNDIYKVQMPNITPHVCRHTYCSNQAKAGMNPKTLQYLMGHSEIGVTLNTYTHLGLEDAAEELQRMEEAEAARREQDKLAGKAKDAQKLFKAV